MEEEEEGKEGKEEGKRKESIEKGKSKATGEIEGKQRRYVEEWESLNG